MNDTAVLKSHYWKSEVEAGFAWQSSSGQVLCADALNLLESLDDNIADIVFLDPPFNLGKEYGESGGASDRQPDSCYENLMLRIIEEACRVLSDGGALYLYHIPAWALRFGAFLSNELSFRHWIAVSMKNGFPIANKLYPAHYALLYYTKGAPKSFNRPKIKTPRCRSCNEYIKDYGGYKEHIANGINLSDIWDDFSPVRHSSKKNRAANELPLDLMRRVIQISGTPGGLFVDPFVGSGTSVVAARDAGLPFIAGDREITCCEITVTRLEGTE